MASPNPPRINNESIRYIDSSFDQADSLRNRNQNPDATLNLAPIPYSDGKMVGPGQGGFRLADTPQAWVFIQKKEWLDDTWTYVVNDPMLTKLTENLENINAELGVLIETQPNPNRSDQDNFTLSQDRYRKTQNLQFEASKLKVEIDRIKQQMANNGVSSLIDGKLAQIDIRSALSNIITRKIDWVADHEKFTKSTADYNNSVEMQQFSQQKKYIQNNFRQIQEDLEDKKNEVLTINKSIKTLQDKYNEDKKNLLNIRSIIKGDSSNQEELSKLKTKDQEIADQIKILEEENPNPNSSAKIAEAKSKIFSLEQRVLELQKIPPRVPGSVAEQALGKAHWDKKYAEFAQELSSKQAEIASLQSFINDKNGEQATYDKSQKEIKTLKKQQVELMVKISNLNEKIQKETIEKQKQDIDSNKALNSIESAIESNQKIIQERIIKRDALIKQIQGITNDPTFNFDTGKLYAPVTFSGNAYTRYYKSPLFRTKTNTEAEAEKVKLEKEVERLQNSLSSESSICHINQNQLLQVQLEYIETKRRLDNISIQLIAQMKSAPIAIEIGKENFNGIIELANVSQINTTVNLEGEGNASFTIENPQNIFFIGQEDINLALSLDPFLENAQNPEGLEGMVYYRGRFYPSHMVDMITRRKGYSAGTFNTQEALSSPSFISGQIEDLNRQIREIDVQLSISSGLLTNIDRYNLEFKRASIVADCAELQRQQQNLSNSLSSQIRQQASAGISAPGVDSAKQLAKQTLMKYYLGKAIFQVMDRVYIWMTSPTRTLHQLSRKGDVFAVEDQSAMLMDRQVPAMEEKLVLLQEEKGKLEEYLQNRGFSSSSTEISFFKPNKEKLSTAKNKSDILTLSQAALYYSEVVNEIDLAQATIEVLKKQAKSTDYLTGAMTFNKMPRSLKDGEINDAQTKIISNYDSRYIGIEEDRLQVFQGIISSVKQTFNGSSYQISFTCRDNLFFLNMSRIMLKPALRVAQDPKGILQDPIWRNNPLAGNWKNGIAVLDYAFINDEVRSRIDKKFNIDNSIQANLRNKKVLSEGEAKITGVSPYVTSLPFARIDAANLISFIITGFPYNFKSFIKNAAFGGRLTLQRKAADQREDNSYFAFLKRQIGELNDRLGDFEPYIDLQGGQFSSQSVTDQMAIYTKQLDLSITSLVSSYTRYILKRIESLFKRMLEIPGSNSSIPLIKERDAFLNILSDNIALEKQAILLIETIKIDMFKDFGDKTNPIMNELVKIVMAAVKRAQNTTKMRDVFSTYGRPIATQTEIDDLLKIFQNSKSDLGSFQVVKDLVNEQARSLINKTSLGGVLTPSSPLPPLTLDQQNKVDFASARELSFFIESLLRVQPDFATEYYNATLIASSLNNLKDIQDDLKDFAFSVQGQSASIQASLRDGPQSTLEKIIRSEKKNFLIISDQYELDLDIQAYQSEMSSDFALWQSEWETPMAICKRAADQVDFEFYADESGNLQFKPPSYNRILKEHFGLISETDGQVRNAILIRYGNTDGLRLKAYLRAIAILRQLQVEFSAKHILYIKESTETTATVAHGNKIPSQSEIAANAEEIVKQEEKELRVQEGIIKNSSRSWNPILAGDDSEQQAEELSINMHIFENKELERIKNINKDRENEIIKARGDIETLKTAIVGLEKEDKEAKDSAVKVKLEEQIKDRKRVMFSYLSKSNESVSIIEMTRSKMKKQLYVKLYSNIEFLLKEAGKTLEEVRQKTESFVNALPHFMDEHRIHRIADYDLITYDLSEEPPKFTYLEVTGSPELVQTGPSEYYWAGGVDYDNWRQYGFISENINKAYFHSGDQARTYLRAMLGRERGRIFKASLSVRGDSKYRVGDCVFIECLGMYFYISSTTQSFSYGGSYTTSLSLTYGRRIGEIIPHPFDVLGKIMIDIYQSDLEELLAQQKYLDTKENTKT